MRNKSDFSECGIMCITGTWPQEDTPDPSATIDSCQTAQVHRKKSDTGKEKSSWHAYGATHIIVKEDYCCCG